MLGNLDMVMLFSVIKYVCTGDTMQPKRRREGVIMRYEEDAGRRIDDNSDYGGTMD